MPTIALSTGEVHYLEQGHGEPLLLLHANPGDSRDFEAVMPELARHFRVLVLDWPAYGQSALPAQAGSCDALFFYRVLREFVEALALPPLHLIGNSLGGNAAARLALEAPDLVKRLVLVSPGGFTAHNLVTRAFCKLQGSRASLPPRLWAAMYLRRRTATTRAMLARAATDQSASFRLAVNRAVWRSFADPSHDLRGRAGRIQAPTLLMFGEQDPAIPAHKDGQQAKRWMPSALGVTMPCGHAPFAEMPERFLAEVLPFLTQAISTGASGGPARADTPKAVLASRFG